MRLIDGICFVLGGLSMGLFALSLFWVVLQMAFGSDLPDPPRGVDIGLLGAMASGLLFGGAHLIHDAYAKLKP